MTPIEERLDRRELALHRRRVARLRRDRHVPGAGAASRLVRREQQVASRRG